MYSLNPNFSISNIILSYYGYNSENYQKIREAVRDALRNTSISFSLDFNVFSKKEGLVRFNILYISPLIEHLPDVRSVLLGDIHHNEDITNANSALIDSLIEPNGTFFAEELIWSPRAIESERLKTLIFTVLKLTISENAWANLAVQGWDYKDLPLYAAAKMIERGAPGEEIALTLQEEDRVKAILEDPHQANEYLGARMERATPSFINAIRHWAIHSTTLSGRAFAIAGLGHLTTLLPVFRDARFNLRNFYELLRHLPVMVLFPRVKSTIRK